MVPLNAEAPDKMRIKASRVKRLIRRKVLASERAPFLQSLISAMNNRTSIRRLTPGQALIQLQSPHWELYSSD